LELRSLYREPEAREKLSFGALEFHDVFRIFRSGPVETVALRGLDLRIEPRELVALYGPSGSGKSTALHLAAGLDEPSAGDVVAFGRSLARLGETELAAYRAREVAIIFQGRNLWPGLSAREITVLGLLPSMLSLEEIALDLTVSVNTVKSHTRSIYTKLGVSSRRLAVLAAHERGLLITSMH